MFIYIYYHKFYLRCDSYILKIIILKYLININNYNLKIKLNLFIIDKIKSL